jgi:hypothetical protein
MNLLRWIVQSRIWVALAAAAWSVESFVRCDQWVRWTLVLHIFFLTWSAYLFLSDDGMRRYRNLVLTALTGVCVTFQGFDSLSIPALCALPVLFYRTHWMPHSWRLARFELRNIPILNNVVIGLCWVVLCMLWPMHRSAVDLVEHVPFLVASFCWVTALSMSEDLFVESTPDASLRLLGYNGLKGFAMLLVIMAMAIGFFYHEQQLSVWISMTASFMLLLLMPRGKRTVGKSWLIDAMIVLRFPF